MPIIAIGQNIGPNRMRGRETENPGVRWHSLCRRHLTTPIIEREVL